MMEKLCRCWIACIKTARLYFAPFLVPLISTLVKLFAEAPHSAFIYVAAACVRVFGPEPKFRDEIVEILHAYVESALPLLKELDSFRLYPDIAEDMFDFLTKYLMYCPHVLVNDECLRAVISSGLQGICIDHKEASLAILFFFETLVRLRKYWCFLYLHIYI